MLVTDLKKSDENKRFSELFSGFGMHLRPVEVRDASFIHALRSDPALSAFIGDTSGGVAAQENWIRDYQQREDDLYFCVESTMGIKLGTIGIYGIKSQTAEWGRWVLSPETFSAPGSLYLVYRVIFEKLRLERTEFDVVAANTSVVALHERTGARRILTKRASIQIAGILHDQFRYEFTKTDWENYRPKLQRLAAVSARLLPRVENQA